MMSPTSTPAHRTVWVQPLDEPGCWLPYIPLEVDGQDNDGGRWPFDVAVWAMSGNSLPVLRLVTRPASGGRTGWYVGSSTSPA